MRERVYIVYHPDPSGGNNVTEGLLFKDGGMHVHMPDGSSGADAISRALDLKKISEPSQREIYSYAARAQELGKAKHLEPGIIGFSVHLPDIP